MSENDLKKYTVMLGNGSGVLFQPTDFEYTYILSAKHIFYDKIENDRGTTDELLKGEIEISFSGSQENKAKLTINKGNNYFEHSDENIDAAIFILNDKFDCNQIYIDESSINYSNYNLTGYPQSRRGREDQYNKYKITGLISSSENLSNLRLEVNHLTHDNISGFSGGGILKINGDSLIIAGIQSRTPEADCNGEILIVPITKFTEITTQNNLSQLFPEYLSSVKELINDVIKLDDTNLELKPKLKTALRFQLEQVKLNLLDVYKSDYIEKACISKLNKKTRHFWVAFLEYALIVSLLQDSVLDEGVLSKVIREKKFIFSDSEKNVYEMFSEILTFASEDIENDCQVLVGSVNVPHKGKTRRILTKDIPRNIAQIESDDFIDRVSQTNKIKEIIHLKAIEFDCINENEELLNAFSLEQFKEILNQIKNIVNDFFKK